jgi:hypothetical protein
VTRSAAALVLVLAAACGGGQKRSAAAPPAAITAPPPDETSQASRTGWSSKDKTAARQAESIRKAPAAAVLRVVRVDDECSNAGGTHLTLEVVTQAKGTALKRVAAGGHALWIDAKPGDVYVAGIGPPADAKRRSNPGWCLKGLPDVDGYATTIVKAATVEEAEARLRELLGK